MTIEKLNINYRVGETGLSRGAQKKIWFLPYPYTFCRQDPDIQSADFQTDFHCHMSIVLCVICVLHAVGSCSTQLSTEEDTKLC